MLSQLCIFIIQRHSMNAYIMTLLVGLSMCGSTLVSEFDFDGISWPVLTRPIEITITQWDSLLTKQKQKMMHIHKISKFQVNMF